MLLKVVFSFYLYIKKQILIIFLWKEVIQPQVLLRLPCYDFTPVAKSTVEGSYFSIPASNEFDSHGVTGGEYKTRERIHRSIADLRLLAIPTSCSRVADYNPNWGTFWGLAPSHDIATHCRYHCIMCVAQGIKGHADLASSSPSSPLCIYEYEWASYKHNETF